MEITENKLVGYSRAGDTFHYLWAARRCLRMIYPKSPIHHIVVEGSDKPQLGGEYVIDLTEYVGPTENDLQEITHFQLKHTTVRKEQPFQLSDLKDTITGFARRYSEYLNQKDENRDSLIVSFSIITNRPINEEFKRDVDAVVKANTVNARFLKTIEKYTNLKGENLAKFCSTLNFVDGEGDYIAQKYQLHAEIAQLLAGVVDTPQVDTIVQLIAEKVLPNSDGRIVREEIFRRLGATSERDLYPAPPEFEKLDKSIPRKQHRVLVDHIINSTTPTIIQAVSGVGKSVFACQITQFLPIASFGVVYDCFGGGRYRNRSEPRHRHRDALVQIANELASEGLCDPLISSIYRFGRRHFESIP